MNTEGPDRPENLVASSIDSRSAIISWTNGYTGNSVINSFQVEHKTAEATAWSSPDGSLTSSSSSSGPSAPSSSSSNLAAVAGSSNSVTLRKLKPLTSYMVRIRAENSLGSSEFSEILQFTTEEEGQLIHSFFHSFISLAFSFIQCITHSLSAA